MCKLAAELLSHACTHVHTALLLKIDPQAVARRCCAEEFITSVMRCCAARTHTNTRLSMETNRRSAGRRREAAILKARNGRKTRGDTQETVVGATVKS